MADKEIAIWNRRGSSRLIVRDDRVVPGRVRVNATSDFRDAYLVFSKSEIVEFAKKIIKTYGDR